MTLYFFRFIIEILSFTLGLCYQYVVSGIVTDDVTK